MTRIFFNLIRVICVIRVDKATVYLVANHNPNN